MCRGHQGCGGKFGATRGPVEDCQDWRDSSEGILHQVEDWINGAWRGGDRAGKQGQTAPERKHEKPARTQVPHRRGELALSPRHRARG